MIFGGYLSRGVLCLIIGILYLVVAGLHIHYYNNNEIATEENRDKQLIFGPNLIIGLNLFIKIVTFIMFLVLSLAFLLSWKFDEHVSSLVSEACTNRTSLTSDIKSFIGSKLDFDNTS